jgi:hypothetical protein
MVRPSDEQLSEWLAVAESLRSTLVPERVEPVAVATVVADPEAFQGWRVVRQGERALPITLKQGESVLFDFGEHLVGQLELRLRVVRGPQDAPLRVRLVLGEVPAEVAEPFDHYSGWLSRSWLQDEVLNLDIVDEVLVLPRRYAFQFVKVEILATGRNFDAQLEGIACLAVTAAQGEVPPAGADEELRAIDAVALRTLRNCMLTVFEDGPKRDRRLWLGDLRLQALGNYRTYRNHDLVKRSLCLLAGFTREDGAVPACVYEYPRAKSGDLYILDYCALFGATVLEYAESSSDWELARQMAPLAFRQIDIVSEKLDEHGTFVDDGTWWVFIDWSETLDKQAAMHGVLMCATLRCIELAERLEMPKEVQRLRRLHERLQVGAERLRDAGTGLFLSGKQEQVSWGSQAWMALGEAVTGDEAASVLRQVAENPDAVRPGGPYLYHYVVEAMLKAGMQREADALLRKYWGAMVRRGASTFWEVFDPTDEHRSPYGSHLVNSYCHAWSCTPAYLLRR